MKYFITPIVLLSTLLATIINVPGDQPTIQSGIDASADGDTVLVQPGTYVENINFNGHNITLGSMFIMIGDTSYISQTVIDGNQSGSVVTFENNENSNCLLSGFSIVNGSGTWTSIPGLNPVGDIQSGGGVICIDSSPLLRDLHIFLNSLDSPWAQGAGVSLISSNSTLQSVTIDLNYSAGRSAGIFIGENSDAAIYDSVISYNESYTDGVIYCHSSVFFVSNTEILNNTLYLAGVIQIHTSVISFYKVLLAQNSGIYSLNAYSSNLILESTTISGNTLGISTVNIGFDSTVNILNSIIWDNSGHEFSGFAGSTLSVSYSDIQGGYEIIADDNPNMDIVWGTGNINSNPMFSDPDFRNYTLLPGSPCIDTGDPSSPLDLDGTRIDMGAYYHQQISGCTDPIALNFNPDATYDDESCEFYDGPTWYVSIDGSEVFGNGTYEQPFPTIQQGINSAEDGDTVLVLPGIYYENLSVAGQQNLLTSLDGPDETIIDGNGLSNVIQSNIEDGILSSWIISGFSIINGYHGSGGGISVGGYFSFDDMIIESNIATSNGGGVLVDGNSQVTIQNSIIRNNQAQRGGGISTSSNLTIVNCTIDDNVAYENGGAFYASDADDIINISGTHFNNNYLDQSYPIGFGGAIFCHQSNIIATNSTFLSNSTNSSGGAIYAEYGSNLYVESSIFTQNETNSAGSAVFNYNSTTELQNCTITDNNGNGPAVFSNGNSLLVVRNCIIFFNSINDLQINGGQYNISYSDFIDDVDGIGNINLPPQFADQSTSDFLLSIDSPCIDAGDPDLNNNGITWEMDELDQDPDGTRMDIGASYFHQIFGCTNPEAVNYNPEATTDDGSCDYLGCTDEAAINFNPEATIDDGSCIYLEDVEPHFSTAWDGIPISPMGFYIASATIEGINLRIGDELAVFDGNYCVGQAQLTSEIIPYLQLFASQDNPATEEIDGFINGDAIHYRFWDASEQIEIINIEAEVTQGSLVFQSLGFTYASLSVELAPGCIDPMALNYNPEANTDDGSCIFPIFGCMDITACNYDPEANTDLGSCQYWDCAGVCGGIAYEDDCGDCDDDSGNDNACFGCTDPLAINYDPMYTINDGSCEYPGMGDVLPDGNINVLDIVALVEITLESLPYVFYGDLNNDGFNNIIDIVILVDIILNPELLGCTDPQASNFNPEAIYDNGGCVYPAPVMDIDGNCYETIQIGNQIWMAENLKTTHYNNGDEIPTGFSNSEWVGLSTGAYAVYNNDPANAEIYGNLYNWYAVDDSRGICPEGFHMPSDEEWMELEMNLGMTWEDANDIELRGTDQGSQLAGDEGLWNTGELVNNPAFGSSGFEALPGGQFDTGILNFTNMDHTGYFWTSSDEGLGALYRALYSSSSEVYRFGSDVYKPYGFSVRCVQD